jgi:hypothetical protein
MNQVEALSKGLPWTDFQNIPQVFKNIYTLLLATDQLTGWVVSQTGEYEMCCEYWFNNTLLKAMGEMR